MAQEKEEMISKADREPNILNIEHKIVAWLFE
jgi:hypothetical protein